jgi:competence protein ComEA
VPELSRSQLLVYGAIAVALLLVGARWLRSAEGADAGPPEAGVAEAAGAPQEGAGDESLAIEQGADGVVVHVAGAVRDPGVYRLPQGSRVTDALERAGGATAAAAPDGINLAATLADGQQVVVPAKAGGGSVAATAPTLDGPISLGTATIEQLDTIEGIGPVTAEDILEFRDEHGGIGSIEELDQISGIGPATMEALRDGLAP